MKSRDLTRSSIVEVKAKVTRDPNLCRFDKLFLDHYIKEYGSYNVVVKIAGSLGNGEALGIQMAIPNLKQDKSSLKALLRIYIFNI
ncbi:uncharacterized protein Bfra_006261 [Botrytis fragariae]|uniref:Uncharacterized protein n=1 Tax=Botrytis fragariae TaxID=1964551 RepID=A0A8H6B4W9_9HELO|nr:uncharacterized protein Bfra_006261 [Botrytis fragariae]KAF5879057.1 hypothetical protein Bfra_006261 [Botrytis fragariae]